MFLKSIRWRLQAWHGLILLCVLGGFGVTAYQLQRGNQVRRVDQELQRRVGVVLGELRAGRPAGRPPVNGPGPERPRPDRGPGGGAGGGPGGGAGGRPGGREDRQEFPPPPPRELRLSAVAASLFDGETNAFYFVVWSRDGGRLAQSENSSEGVPPPARPVGAAAALSRTRGDFREAYQFTPPGECILVGRSTRPELAELRRFALLLTGAGGLVLLLGLAGGGWLATRAIRPVEEISATASRISGGNLSERISVAETDDELGRLAGVLNSTFARLEGAFAQQQQFTSDAAHELRTPVSVLLTQTQSALARERPAAEYRETLEACARAAQRMRRLIESLLELARLDAGQEPMKRGRFDLARTAREAIDLVRPLAAERGILIRADLATAECPGDAERIHQVITNLLTNAIHYNQEDGEVRVAVSASGGTALLDVADTGRGISEADLPRVFERFYRADKSRTGANGRAGLGLAISKAIVEAHRGTIEASSAPGNGATFTVRLPLA